MSFQKGNKIGPRFKKGEVSNPSGRPRKLLSSLKADGYKESQVMDTLSLLLALSIDELKKISADKTGQYTALEMVCAGAIVSNHKKKTQYNVLQLVERIFGKPKESVSHELSGTIDLTLDLGNNGSTES